MLVLRVSRKTWSFAGGSDTSNNCIPSPRSIPMNMVRAHGVAICWYETALTIGIIRTIHCSVSYGLDRLEMTSRRISSKEC